MFIYCFLEFLPHLVFSCFLCRLILKEIISFHVWKGDMSARYLFSCSKSYEDLIMKCHWDEWMNEEVKSWNVEMKCCNSRETTQCISLVYEDVTLSNTRTKLCKMIKRCCVSDMLLKSCIWFVLKLFFSTNFSYGMMSTKPHWGCISRRKIYTHTEEVSASSSFWISALFGSGS